jgi:hypothetical protein
MLHLHSPFLRQNDTVNLRALSLSVFGNETCLSEYCNSNEIDIDDEFKISKLIQLTIFINDVASTLSILASLIPIQLSKYLDISVVPRIW